MSLLVCPDCFGKVSDLAPACPHCGRPASKIRVDSPPTAQPVSEQAQQDDASGVSEATPSRTTFGRPSTWEEVGTRDDLIDQIRSGQIPGCCMGEAWYFDPNPKKDFVSGAYISPEEDPEIFDKVVRREIDAIWGQSYIGLETVTGWHLQSPHLVWLACRHQALGQLKIIRVRGTLNWFAAFLPGLWHLVTWTKNGLRYWIAGTIATILGRLGLAFSSEGWVFWWAEGIVHVILFFHYLRSANGFRERSLRDRGFQVVSVIQAKTKDEVLAKLDASGSEI